MTIQWPNAEEPPEATPSVPSSWGQVRLSRNDWFDHDRSPRRTARDIGALVAILAVMLLIGALLFGYGPLPHWLPQDCPGCFVSRP